jgi:ribosome modulation factor
MQARKSILGVLAGAALLAGTSPAIFAQGPPPPGYYQQGPPPGYQGQPWEAAPPEFQEVERRGFHDGIEGARKDFDNHRRPDVDNRDEFRHPNVRPADRRAYRQAFRRGYQVGVQHIYQGH